MLRLNPCILVTGKWRIGVCLLKAQSEAARDLMSPRQQLMGFYSKEGEMHMCTMRGERGRGSAKAIVQLHPTRGMVVVGGREGPEAYTLMCIMAMSIHFIIFKTKKCDIPLNNGRYLFSGKVSMH